jgi:hypothetical protein
MPSSAITNCNSRCARRSESREQALFRDHVLHEIDISINVEPELIGAGHPELDIHQRNCLEAVGHERRWSRRHKEQRQRREK